MTEDRPFRSWVTEDLANELKKYDEHWEALEETQGRSINTMAHLYNLMEEELILREFY